MLILTANRIKLELSIPICFLHSCYVLPPAIFATIENKALALKKNLLVHNSDRLIKQEKGEQE